MKGQKRVDQKKEHSNQRAKLNPTSQYSPKREPSKSTQQGLSSLGYASGQFGGFPLDALREKKKPTQDLGVEGPTKEEGLQDKEQPGLGQGFWVGQGKHVQVDQENGDA